VGIQGKGECPPAIRETLRCKNDFQLLKPGGVREDIPEGFIPQLNEFIKDMEKRIEDYEQLINSNEIFLMRMKNIA